MTHANYSPPKVFISYSHDSIEHRTRILKLAEQLRALGLEAWIDQYEHPWPEKGWPHWMQTQIAEADFVLMVCTDTYYRRVMGKEEADKGQGVCWESHLIYSELYSEKMSNRKFIPVFFDKTIREHIPNPLTTYSAYVVNDNADFQQLYAIISKQPTIQPSPLGPLQVPETVGYKAAQAEEQKPLQHKHKYFISYTRREETDENLARYLHEGLIAQGHAVFIDISIKIGTDWLAEIRSKIKWCDYLVLLLSRTAMRSEMVLREVRMALANQRAHGKPRILPVRIEYDGALDYELDLFIGRLQHISWNVPQDPEMVLDSITQPPAASIGQAKKPDATSFEKNQPGKGRPEHAMDLRRLAAPDVSGEDEKYIARPEDKTVLALAGEIGETLVIKGANQMGKSSLLARYIQACKKHGKEIAVIDFAMFGREELSSYASLLSNLAGSINNELDINDGEFPEIRSQVMMVAYFRKRILPAVPGSLTIAFDEVDRLMGQPYATDFFTMLRSFHGSRSRTKWGETDLVLVISTEPYLLIPETERSPFNVVLPVILNPFSRQECAALNQTYENPLTQAELDELYTLLQGHPYLTRLAYYHLKDTHNYTLADLIEKAHDERGPFGEHLRAKLADLQEGEGLIEGMKQVLIPETRPDRDMAYRLHGAGLIRFRDHNDALPANLLYHRYFKRVLDV